MSLIDVDELQLFSGKSQMFKDICLVYPPTQGTIADIGLATFYNYIGVQTIDKSELFEDAEEGNEIIYLMATAQLNEDFLRIVKDAFRFFTKEEIVLIPELSGIQFGDLKEGRILLQEDFLLFQEYIKSVCALNIGETKSVGKDSAHVRRIKERIKRGQALVAKAKAKQGKTEDELDLIDLVSSYLAKATEVDIKTIWDMPYYMFQIQFRRMQMIEEYDINLKASLAGAKIPKEKMKHWIKKIQ